MQFSFNAILAVLSLSALVAPSLAQGSVSVSFDNTYDDADGSTNTVACSTGPNGLASRFPTFGSFPSFPRIGGAPAITGFGSASCGTCWKLTFNGVSINVLGIDVALDGFNISEEAMNQLTNGQAVDLGRVTATFEQVDASACGL